MEMPFVVGIVLSAVVAAFARRAGLDRDRTFYTTVLIIVGSYYVLFAAIGGTGPVMVVESLVMGAFASVAVMGFRNGPWILVIGLAGHGVFDALHGSMITNPGMPGWWPAFCGDYDIGAAGWLAWLTARSRPHQAGARSAAIV